MPNELTSNSVSVPVIDKLCKAIVDTGVFENEEKDQIELEVINENNR